MRTIFVAIAVAAVGFVGLQSAKAYTAPWCAVINYGNGSMYWDWALPALVLDPIR
jgi:hypothetical protein